jgi:hypothetical protein
MSLSRVNASAATLTKNRTEDSIVPLSGMCVTCVDGCIYVCPACQLRCTYTESESAICGGCANLAPPCVEKEVFDDMMCYMDPCVACEIEKK